MKNKNSGSAYPQEGFDGEIYYTQTSDPDSARVDINGKLLDEKELDPTGPTATPPFPKKQPDVQRSPTDATPISESEPQIPTSDGTETLEEKDEAQKPSGTGSYEELL